MQTHTFKQDFIIPATGNPNAGYILFPKTEFALTYEVRPNAAQKTMTVILWVCKISDNSKVWPLEIYDITEKGFPTSVFTNQNEYAAYIETKTQLENSISTLAEELESIRGQLPTAGENLGHLNDLLNTKKEELTQLEKDLANLEVVQPIPVHINTYDEVVNYFKGDGSLTPEGIEWAKTVYYKGQLIGDIIE